MSTYRTGPSAQSILLSVDINTTGKAATQVTKRITGSSGEGQFVTESNDVSGDIKNSDIGGATSLIGFTLTIATTINPLGTKTERKEEFKKLTSTYKLSGGNEGVKNYPEAEFKLHSADFKNVTLIKNITIIP